jgi:ABC-2 type transport system ATP-binding protein
LSPGVEPGPVARIVRPVASGDIHLDAEANRISLPVTERTRALVTVATALSEARIEPEDISLRRPTLDEVFLHLTGPTKEDHSPEVSL